MSIADRLLFIADKTANGYDHTEKLDFLAQNFICYSVIVIVLFVSVTVSIEINRRQYFHGDLHTFQVIRKCFFSYFYLLIFYILGNTIIHCSQRLFFTDLQKKVYST